MGDRVVCAVNSGSVPYGSRGTVVAVEESKLDVVFDKELIAGNSMGGRCVACI